MTVLLELSEVLTEMAEQKEKKKCIYDGEYDCNVLTRLFVEFADKSHLSLIFDQILPKYCENCPHLALLRTREES